MSASRMLRSQMLRLMAVAAVAAGLVAAGLAASRAQSPSPYDMTFKAYNAPAGGVPLRSGMDDGAGVVGTLPANASGIVLRWCRKEFGFGEWQFGNAAVKRKALDQRWCEVSYNGRVGNVHGSMLAPE